MNVKIHKPAKTAMQSGRGKTRQWVVEYETQSRREPEPLMGWTRSADTLNQVKINFDSLEEALNFVSERGWNYTIIPAQERRVTPRNYSDNFKYTPPAEES